ncbi:putative damage-inducible protein DinB [Paenibacillus endophyticus]|uniref:Putative damage-inducible protein DinB n=1 Tax=Paenibacillus endophyticus TaxID=1294268 RepID=A0A7W5GAN0_9BACL|nr:DinB family protein [Paenibacillus endophyticus]MBB3153399.1 putative damage-inducible protein DinB [Paenibacillus endophyticus]
MSAVNEVKAVLLEELEHIVKTSSNLIRKISPEHWSFRPHANMRSLLELTEHLVSVPSSDLLILQENSETVIRRLEADIAENSDIERLIGWMATGLHEVKSYMESLSEEDFLHKSTKPFYLEHGTVQAKWLVEITTHAQHHRAQLFTYLKMQGYEVNMFDLY